MSKVAYPECAATLAEEGELASEGQIEDAPREEEVAASPATTFAPATRTAAAAPLLLPLPQAGAASAEAAGLAAAGAGTASAATAGRGAAHPGSVAPGAPGGWAPLLVEQLRAVKEEGKHLASLHREARERAARRLPELGALLDAEEELLEALTLLRASSPLLLVDGAPGAGKSTLIEALLRAADEEAGAAAAPFGVPVGLPRGRGTRPLIVRAPTVRSSGGQADGPRRLMEGFPSMQSRGSSEPRMRLLSGAEAAVRLPSFDDATPTSGGGASPTSVFGDGGIGALADVGASVAAAAADTVPVSTAPPGASGEGDDECLPFILEDARVRRAWGESLWFTEVNVEDPGGTRSRWVSACRDALCVLRPAASRPGAEAGGGAEEVLSAADEARVRAHLEGGRRLLLVANLGGAEGGGDDADADGDGGEAARRRRRRAVEEAIRGRFAEDEAEDIEAICVVELPAEVGAGGAGGSPASSAPPSPSSLPRARGCGGSGIAELAAAVRSFAQGAERRRLEAAAEHLSNGREAFVQWCTKGAKVVSAASSQFQQDAEDVRLARDLITRNIDAAYLAHVFSSVLVGKFAMLCSRLEKLPAPDLGGRWGRHATRQVMERSLREELEQGLRVAMQESLEEVTTEMARQEQPSVDRIQRVARKGTSMPWEAEMKRLEVELDKGQLQHFAMHFFGSLSVGVLSGIGALALEVLLGELALGPVGIIAGVATFVAIGVQNSDWPSVRGEFVRQARAQHLELVHQAKQKLDFPGLCERRKRRILEQMDIILSRLLSEVAALAEAASEFARCALALHMRPKAQSSSRASSATC